MKPKEPDDRSTWQYARLLHSKSNSERQWSEFNSAARIRWYRIAFKELVLMDRTYGIYMRCR